MKTEIYNLHKTNRSTSCTAFTGATIKCTYEVLHLLFGEPQVSRNSGREETNFEWHLEDTNNDIYTIYDWRTNYMIALDEEIEWHIGSYFGQKAIDAKAHIEAMIFEAFAYLTETI